VRPTTWRGLTNENFQNDARKTEPARRMSHRKIFGFNVGATDAADICSFMGFMKLLDQPAAGTFRMVNVSMASINNGRPCSVFTGCALVSHANLTTRLFGRPRLLSPPPANLFSDLAVLIWVRTLPMGSRSVTASRNASAGPSLGPGAGGLFFFPCHDGRTSALAACDWRALRRQLRAAVRSAGGCVQPDNQIRTSIQIFHGLVGRRIQYILNFCRFIVVDWKG